MISCSSKGVVSGETHPRRIWAVCLSWRQHKHHCRGKCLKQESLLMQGIPQRGLGTRGHEKYRCETSVCAKRTQGAGSDSNPEPPPQTPELVLGEAWGICFQHFFSTRDSAAAGSQVLKPGPGLPLTNALGQGGAS